MVREPVDARETVTKIRDLVEVQAHPTVVRLEESLDEAWISTSYYLTEDVRVHVEALGRALTADTGTGSFLIGPYGSGKSHFLAWLTQQLRAGELVEGATPDVVAVSLLNYSAQTRLEDVVCAALGIETGTDDRRTGWDAAVARPPGGLLLVIDELSELLRSHPDAQRFTEDIRFLQFMGEWAMGHRFVVVAAMQEAIEHTGDLEHSLYRKIKDRYGLRLRLTPAHVHDLIANHVLVKQPGYEAATEQLARHLASAVPDAPVPFDQLCRIYPLHPATLELLDEVRDRFSQTRGVVDFVCTQLGGHPQREVAPFLDREWGELVTPDAIVDHFEDVLQLQPEFLPIAQRLLPWYERHLPELFDKPGQRRLAERLLRLLVVVHLSPSRDGMDADEASGWLLFAATRIDPTRNRAIVERVLQRLAREGRYVRQVRGRFALDLQDDGAAVLDRLLQRELAELPGPDALFEQLGRTLGRGGRNDFNPLAAPRDRWQPRTVKWSFHDRDYAVFVGNGEPPPADGPALCVRLPWGDAPPADGCHTVRPKPAEMTPALRELAALVRLRERPLNPEVARLLASRVEQRLPLFAMQLRQSYAEAALVRPDRAGERGLPLGPTDGLEPWFDAHALWMLRRQYPAFEKHGPGHGPLPREAYREFVRHAMREDVGAARAPRWVQTIREAYLVPMRLLSRQGNRYTVPARLDRNDLVRRLLPLVEQGATMDVVYEHMAAPVFGLVEDQIHLLLVLLLVTGELDILQGQRSYRELFETQPKPRAYDRIAPGTALGEDQLQSLDRLCEGLRVSRPDTWTVNTQRRAVRAIRGALDASAADLRKLQARLGAGSELTDAIERYARQVAALRHDRSDLEGFEQFLYQAGSATGFLARHADLVQLPARVDRQLPELRRYAHLFKQPGLADLAGELGTAPGLEQGAAVDDWLRRARETHEAYKTKYAAAHEAWWSERRESPVWTWQPPRIAPCRHVGLGPRLLELETLRRQAQQQRCARLVDLEFQTRCSCGFDGETSPAAGLLATLDRMRGEVEHELELFFGQSDVRARVRDWARQGVEVTDGLQAYLDGEQAWPDVEDLSAFDDHLAGVDVVTTVDLGGLTTLLTERTWDRAALRKALDEYLGRLDGERIRFDSKKTAAGPDVVPWCLEQALRHGVPLPREVDGAGHAVDSISADWVGAGALQRLDRLGLDAACEDRVLEMVLRADLPPVEHPSPLVAAATELIAPTKPASAHELAVLAELLYRHHPRLTSLAPGRWLARLDELAGTDMDPRPPLLAGLLDTSRDAAWIVIDAFGLPLLGPITGWLDDLLPAWRVAQTTFARVDGPTTTEGFYRQLADAGLDHALEKVDAVDELLHERTPAFEDLCRLARAELEVAFGRMRKILGPGGRLLLFGDHGFRLTPDGKGWQHGGDSSLERIVPVIELVARTNATRG